MMVGGQLESQRDILGRGVGVFLLASILILNNWVLPRVFSYDGQIETGSIRTLIWAMDALLAFGGAFIIWKPAYGRLALLGILPLLSLGACSFIVFALLELFPSLIEYMPFRSAHYYDQKFRYVPDDELIYRYRPSLKIETPTYKGDSYRAAYGVDIEPLSYRAAFDEYGFRNKSALPQAWEVVVLGDSFIEFGHDEDDTFTRRLEALSGMKVRNLGIGGYGPFQYMKVLERYGLTPRPRYVLFCFFEGNDIADISRYLRWKDTNVFPYPNLKGMNFLQRYLTAFTDVVLRPLMKALEEEEGVDDLVVLKLPGRDIKAVLQDKIENRAPDELLKTREWRALKELLAQLKAVSAMNHIVPLVVFIPTKAHIYAEHSTSYSESHGLSNRAQQIAAKSHVETALQELCQQIDLELKSLSSSFEEAANEGKFVYYPFDTHWNSEGRHIAATVMAEALPAVGKK